MKNEEIKNRIEANRERWAFIEEDVAVWKALALDWNCSVEACLLAAVLAVCLASEINSNKAFAWMRQRLDTPPTGEEWKGEE